MADGYEGYSHIDLWKEQYMPGDFHRTFGFAPGSIFGELTHNLWRHVSGENM